MHTGAIDPIKAMCELRERVRKQRERCEMQSDSFWYNADGSAMTYEEIRHAAQRLMLDAGIHDHRAYHIKHATISWLHKKGVPSDQIIRFIRHSLGSTTYMEYYLSEDLGEQCTRVIESTALLGELRSDLESNLRRNDTSEKGEAGKSNPLTAIAESIDAAVAAPVHREQPKMDHASSTPRS
jgi:hypothetical protein